MAVDPQISIVICTHNRAAYLDGCLGSIANQNYPGAFEVVVIDNASQDDTCEFLAGWCARDHRFRMAREPRLGLSVAKNLGVKMARAPLILFTDDDVIADPNWITAYVAFFAKHGSDWIVAGGKIVPVADNLKPWPTWCGARAVDDIALLDYETEGILAPRHYVWGANMAVPKAVFERLGLWDESLGNRGTQPGGFEDVEFQDRAREKGFSVWFCPEAVLQHRIKRQTITPRRVVGAAFSRGISDFWERSIQEWGAIERAPRQSVLKCAAALCATMIWWCCAALGFSLVPRRLFIENARRAARACGWWFGAMSAGRGSDKSFRLAKEWFVKLQKRLLALLSGSATSTV